MGRRKKVFGTCGLCGVKGKMSFEHVPPKAAFNNMSRRYIVPEEEILYSNSKPLYKLFQDFIVDGRAKVKQGGLGVHTICSKCNSFLGLNYCNDYIHFSWQVYNNFFKSVEPSISLPYYFHPLRLIKQVISMFLAIDTNCALADREELVDFVLNRSQRGIPANYQVFCYANKSGVWRRNSYSIISTGKQNRFGKMQMYQASEITQPPLGFMLLRGFDDSDKRLLDITNFSQFGINDWKEMYLELNVLSTASGNLPNIYLSEEQLDKVYQGE